MKKITMSIITMIALAVLVPAEEPEAKPAEPAAEAFDAEVAKQLEKQAMGYWAPDAEAMQNWLIEEKAMKKEEAKTLVGEPSTLTIHVEPGKIHLYTKQGIVSTPYEILGANKDTGSLTLRAAKEPDAPEADKVQSVRILIKEGQITVLGGELPFILKKIDEAEFKKRKDALPEHPVGP